MDEYFEGKSFFVTGATGFLGKVLVEKLLRCVPTVDQIFLLIRSRKGVEAGDRLQKEIIDSRVFDRLRNELGTEGFATLAKSKLVAVAGDITSPGLGLCSEEAQVVRERAQIVVHSAATVRFNEPLDIAVKMNCVGALNAIRFARSLERLECYVHVSTAYVNSNLRDLHIREQFYPLAFDVRDAFERVIRATPSELKQLSADLMGTYPNTYTLTKSMGEQLITLEVGIDSNTGTSAMGFPLVINRPTIVGAAWKEPVPGWVDQIAGAGSVAIAIGMGVTTMLPGTRTHIADIVPVDLVVNSILLSVCARIARDRRALSEAPKTPPPSEPLIVHCGTSDPRQNPSGSGHQYDVVTDYYRRNPLDGAEFPTTFRLIENLEDFQIEWLRSYADPATICMEEAKKSGNESDMKHAEKLEKRMRRARRLVEAYGPFTTNQWVFLADTTFDRLYEFSTPMLWVDARDMHWKSYLESFCSGLKKFVLPSRATTSVDTARVRITPSSGAVGHASGGSKPLLMGHLSARSKL